MPDTERILVVAATERELAPSDGWGTLCCGVGPVEASAQTAAAIAMARPAAILHIGIAGARRAAAIAPGTLVIGRESVYAELDVPGKWAPSSLEPDPRLLAAARAVFPDAPLHAIATAARVGGSAEHRGDGRGDGRRDTDIEAMEGFAVLRAAALAGVPALEIRVISNEIEEPDRSRWQFDRAFARVREATPPLVEAFARCVS